jgi:hypothetical protein
LTAPDLIAGLQSAEGMTSASKRILRLAFAIAFNSARPSQIFDLELNFGKLAIRRSLFEPDFAIMRQIDAGW